MREVSGDAKVGIEVGPDGPVRVVGTALCSSESTLYIPLCSVVISARLVLGSRWESQHDVAYGKLELKYDKR